MADCLLNMDLGELEGEDEALYGLAHVASVACGGHAGDEASMRRAVEACRRHGTRLGAHPSYEDREHFGRRELTVAPEVLREQVAAQCGRLAALAAEHGVRVEYAKPHGALYHAARREAALGQAVVAGVVASLGREVTLIGPGEGALREAAQAAGLGYLREGFADRGVRPDGTLVPRGQPGALITEPERVRGNAWRLATGGEVETLCVHGDTPGAVALASQVRAVLDILSLRMELLGESAWRLVLPSALERGEVLEILRGHEGVEDVVVAETHASVYFDARHVPGDIRRALAERWSQSTAEVARPLITIQVRYDGADLRQVAERVGLPEEEIIQRHLGREYRVRAMGFQPGFAYLGEVDERLVLPRLAAPRTRVPAGSVAIAGRRTGIYPLESPGGWNLLGTAVGWRAFTPESGAVLRVGDRVRFERVG